jgi:two-component system sensor histidine kinase YesM
MTIEKARYEDMIDFDVQVDEELLDCRVVKLVLQPLVENAIHHGIQKTGRHGTITVCIYRQEESLVYRVSDDGAGADQEELNALLHAAEDENRGFCIKNVNDRIKLHFGEEYGLSFASSVGRGTTATVRQPRVVGSGHAQRVSR